METKKLEKLAIDSVWYLLNEQVDFFLRKVNVMCNIYNECVELSGITTQNKDLIKELFAEFLVTPFEKANHAVKMATRFNNESSQTIFEDGVLNIRGFARTRISMGVLNKVDIDFRTDDYHFILATILKNFNYQTSSHRKKGLFEIMCEFIQSRPKLQESDEKMIANSLLQCADYAEVVKSLDFCFDTYIAKLLKEFSVSPTMAKEKHFYREIPYKIAKEVTNRFDRRDFYASNRIISSNLARQILNDY